MAALVGSVARVAAEQQADREQRERHAILSARRELITLAIVVAAALAVLGAVVVSYQGANGLLREVHSAAAEQHADTLAALGKTDAQIAALKDQTDMLRDQLAEIKINSSILQGELTGVMQLDNVRINNSPTGWLITPKWTNIAKTEVRNFKGWNHLQFLPSSEDIRKIDFLKLPKGLNFNEPQTIIAGDNITYGNLQVTMAQAWEEIYGKGAIISWGYVEYDDIFRVHHTVQHCERWNFIYDPPAVNMELPQPLSGNCNRRT